MTETTCILCRGDVRTCGHFRPTEGPKKIPCPTCGGSGNHYEEHGAAGTEVLACLDCRGTGEIEDVEEDIADDLLVAWETRVLCPQCGKRYTAVGCGPTHAIISARVARAAREIAK